MTAHQHVVFNGVSSDSVIVISGMPQGSVLGPCLFLSYINDIANGLKSTVHLFTDDMMIYLTLKSTEDAEEFERDLHKLVGWEKT